MAGRTSKTSYHVVLVPLLLAAAAASSHLRVAPPENEVRWHVDAGRAREGVQQWATHVASLGAISGLYGCCGRFGIRANGSFFDEWPEDKYPLSDWGFVHELGITMHFVFVVDQAALMHRTALLAIPDAVRIATEHNFSGYALDYEQPPAGPPGSAAFALESDGLLAFASQFAAALRAVGKELVIDVGGTTAASLSTQTAGQRALTARWGKSGVTTLMDMMTYLLRTMIISVILLSIIYEILLVYIHVQRSRYYGTDVGFNQRSVLPLCLSVSMLCLSL